MLNLVNIPLIGTIFLILILVLFQIKTCYKIVNINMAIFDKSKLRLAAI